MSISNMIDKGRKALTNLTSATTKTSNLTNANSSAFVKASDWSKLFAKVNRNEDGSECELDCSSCSLHYPQNFKIDETERLYGHVNGWSTHVLIATGKTDWVKQIADEKGSVMEAIRDCGVDPDNGTMMLSASNMPVPTNSRSSTDQDVVTRVLLLPEFTYVDNVTPQNVPQLISTHVSRSNRNDSKPNDDQVTFEHESVQIKHVSIQHEGSIPLSEHDLKPSPCRHKYLILMCSQKTRDARCGQSAPILRREFERHLRPLGLYRDLQDGRPGGVGIFFISHVGGHKFSANVMIYRRRERPDGSFGEADQCIWLARVRPEHCEGIVKYTLLQGKVVHPETQLRGGFDRTKGVISW